MDKVFYLNDLYDLYGSLLTEKQQVYFKEYYFDNLSLGEIGDKYNISRNAIFKQLKIIENKLDFFESKLKLLEKKNIINDIINIEENKDIIDKLNNLF